MNALHQKSSKKSVDVNPNRPFVVGLVGGIGSGKSHVAKEFEAQGAELIDADKIAHECLKKPLLLRSLVKAFGDVIIDQSGAIDRRILANFVFGNTVEAKAARNTLESILHPNIHAFAVQKLRKLQEADSPVPFVVVDAPLLIEAGWAPMCDALVFIDTPDAIRLQRCVDRGWTKEEFLDREMAQKPINAKRMYTKHTLSGVAEPKELTAAVSALMRTLKSGK